MQLEEFGRLPLVYEGRVKPFDTLARNTLRQISDRQTFTDESGKQPQRGRSRRSSGCWTWSRGSNDAFKHKVFRIENLDVLQTLGLERREGFRYSLDEFRDKIGEFERQAELAAKTEQENPRKLTTYQKKILELDKKMRLFTLLIESFQQPQIRPEHVQEDLTEAIHRHQATGADAAAAGGSARVGRRPVGAVFDRLHQGVRQGQYSQSGAQPRPRWR